MITNGYYLLNSTSQNVYYYTLQYNTYQYGNQLLAFAVPISLPAGYTQPTNWAVYPTVRAGGGGERERDRAAEREGERERVRERAKASEGEREERGGGGRERERER
jgi:hypothetical protein